MTRFSRFGRACVFTSAATLLLVPIGCKREKADQDAKPIVSGDPVVQCDSFDATRRMGLAKSTDGKTLLFEARRDGAYVLERVDMEGRVTRQIDSDVDYYRPLNDGGIVFKSNKGVVFYLKKGLKQPRQLSPKEVKVYSFAVDEQSGTVVYTQRHIDAVDDKSKDEKPLLDIFQVALEDGTSKKLTEGRVVLDAIPGEKAVLVSRREGKIARVPLGGGEEKVLDIGTDRIFIGQSKGHLIAKQVTEPTSKFVAVPLDGSPLVELDFGRRPETLDWTTDDSQFFVFEKNPNGAIFKVDGRTITPLMTTKGPRIKDVVAFTTDSFAVLAEHDTNNNGRSDGADEVDLCFIDRHGSDKPIEMAARFVPKDKLPLIEKFAPLLKEPDLEGAALGFDVQDKMETLQIDAPKATPSDFAALRKRAKELQARIAQIAGADSKLGIRIQYGNAKFTESLWVEEKSRFITYAGVGAAAMAEPSEYDLDVDSSVGFMTPGYINSGPALCKGNVKNVGSVPLENITATCEFVDRRSKLPIASKSLALTPAKLAPGATGSYRIIVTIEAGDGNFRLSLTNGDKKLSYFNAQISERSNKIATVALDVFDKTGLRYMYEDSKVSDDIRLIAVQASPEFDKLGKDEQKTRAAQAMALLLDVLKREVEFHKEGKLRIVPARGALDPEIMILVNGELKPESDF